MIWDIFGKLDQHKFVAWFGIDFEDLGDQIQVRYNIVYDLGQLWKTWSTWESEMMWDGFVKIWWSTEINFDAF